MPDDTKPRRPPKTRQKDNNGHQAPSREAMEIFADAVTTDRGKGRITRAAKKAYPNQKRTSAAKTGSRLLKHPHVAAIIQQRLERAAKRANITRDQVVGMVAEIATGSIFDVLDKDGNLDLDAARKRGVDHLIKEYTPTERHSKDGSSRRTTAYKVNDRLAAIDLLAELKGWKKEPAKNPSDIAREVFRSMRADERYADMTDEDLAKYPAHRFKVPVEELLVK